MFTATVPVMGHEVLRLVAEAGGRCSVETLRCLTAARFGDEAVFGNCHGDVFAFEELLEFLESKGKLGMRAGEVWLGRVPACSGH
jgi:probable metal-binding protein